MKKMIKNVGLALSLGLISLTGFSQTQVQNSDFEAWENVGTDDIEPAHWNSFMSGNCTLTVGCNSAKKKRIDRSTDAHSGTYSARIWSTSTLSIIANGNMTTGQVQMGSTTASDSKNHNKTLRGNSAHNQPFTGRPDSLVVWVKFTPITATDKAKVSAVIHGDVDYRDPNDENDTTKVIAKAQLSYGKTTGWQRLSIPFVYMPNSTATNPSYILITFATNEQPGGGKANDEVLIDDLEMIYIPKFTQVPAICTGGSFTLPTTSTNGITGTWSPAIDNTQTTTYTFTPTAGQGGVTTTMTVTVNQKDTPTFTQIAPITSGQSFTLPTTSDNGITGTWSPAVNNTATTTYTFTPTAGQCANTTTMTVEVTVGLNENTMTDVKVFGFDKIVTVDLTNVEIENATISILDMAGKKIATSALTSKSVNTINLPSTTASGVYMYQIEGKGVIKTGKLAF